MPIHTNNTPKKKKKTLPTHRKLHSNFECFCQDKEKERGLKIRIGPIEEDK